MSAVTEKMSASKINSSAAVFREESSVDAHSSSHNLLTSTFINNITESLHHYENTVVSHLHSDVKTTATL